MAKANPKKYINREITERDSKILRALWKWKLLSTHAIALKFFPKSSPLTAYRRLLRLSEAGFIQSVELGTRWQECWSLDTKGYKYIRHLLGDLTAEGYKSENPFHDSLTTALHWGEWLTNQPDYTQTFTEQQLRRVPIDLWEPWVPQSDLHRPDGYSLYFEGEAKVVVAFETELNIKTRKRYEAVVAFYDAQANIAHVWWLVDSKATFTAIKRSFENYQMRDLTKHHFILLQDFYKVGWSAPMLECKLGLGSLADYLLPLPPTCPPLCSHRSGTLALLDITKKPVLSTSSMLR